MLPPGIKSSAITKYCKHPRRLAFAIVGFFAVITLLIVLVTW